MCKVMIMTGVKHGENAMKFMQASLPFMSKGNRDGVGYAAIDSQGKLFAERWLDPDVAFLNTNPSNLAILDELKDGITVNSTDYSKHGELNIPEMKSIIYHTRFATCAKTFTNVHPFISGNTALIHNGVIRNEFQVPLRKEISTCDSEVILNSYLDNSVNTNPHDIQLTVDDLSGYWACGVLSEDEHGTPILDVFRNDAGAKLYVAYVKEIGGKVWCTESDIIFKTLAALDWDTSMHSFLTKPNTLQRFDAITGDLLSTVTIESSFNYGFNNIQENKKFKKKTYMKEGKKVQVLEEVTTPVNDDVPSDSKYDDKYRIYRSEMDLYASKADITEKSWLDSMLKWERDEYLYECVR